MRILITNDDGITAPGLAAAEDIARNLAGPEGEIWVVAPATERSGVGHCISYIHPMRIEERGPRRFAVEGAPADCVLAGLHHVLRGKAPDLLLSGVNRGYNVAEDTVYSGTIGAAIEGALHGVRSIAMSQYYGMENVNLPDPFAAARAHGPAIIRRLLDAATWQDGPYGVFYNVNFPPLPADQVKGLKATEQGARKGGGFGVKPEISPNGREFLWVTHNADNALAAQGSDAWESRDGYCTVTPLRANLTARDVLADLGAALKGAI